MIFSPPGSPTLLRPGAESETTVIGGDVDAEAAYGSWVTIARSAISNSEMGRANDNVPGRGPSAYYYLSAVECLRLSEDTCFFPSDLPDDGDNRSDLDVHASIGKKGSSGRETKFVFRLLLSLIVGRE